VQVIMLAPPNEFSAQMLPHVDKVMARNGRIVMILEADRVAG
jgi:hypothetical protein